MANIVNNVDLEKVSQTAEKGKEDKSSLKKPIKLTGEWILDPNQGFQFITELGFEKGKEVILKLRLKVKMQTNKNFKKYWEWLRNDVLLCTACLTKSM